MVTFGAISAMDVQELRRRARGLRVVAGDRIAASWRRMVHSLLALALAGAGAGCGGGGGGSGGAGSESFFETREYQANFGLDAVGASTAYAAGATGRGVMVAVVDTGIDVDHPELAAQIAGGSTNIVTGDPQQVDDIDGHGTAVAGIIAARRNQAYWLDLADRVATSAPGPDLHGWLIAGARPRVRSVSLGRRLGLALSISERADEDLPADPRTAARADDAFALDLVTGELAAGQPGRLTVSHGLSLQERFGVSSVEPGTAGGLLSQGAFASPYLALADHRGDGLVLAQNVARGTAFRVGVVASKAERQAPLEQGRTTVVIGELMRSWSDGHALGLQLGSIDEQQSLLDAEGGGALGLPESARTTFLGLTGRLAVADRLALFGQGSLGLTDPGGTGQGLLGELSTLRSSSFALGLSGGDLLAAGDRLTVAVAQPLRVDAGTATLDRPVGRSFEGAIERRAERVDLAPAGREIDLELGYRVALGARRELRLNWLTQLQPGHRQDAGPAHAIALRLRTEL
jgi:Subtilase family